MRWSLPPELLVFVALIFSLASAQSPSPAPIPSSSPQLSPSPSSDAIANVPAVGICPAQDDEWNELRIEVYTTEDCSGTPLYAEGTSTGCISPPLALILVVGSGMINIADCENGNIQVSGYSKKTSCSGTPDISAAIKANVCHRPVANTKYTKYYAHVKFVVNEFKKSLEAAANKKKNDASNPSLLSPSHSPTAANNAATSGDNGGQLHPGIVVAAVLVPLLVIAAALVVRRRSVLRKERQRQEVEEEEEEEERKRRNPSSSAGFELFARRGSVTSMNPLDSTFSVANPQRPQHPQGNKIEGPSGAAGSGGTRRSSITFHRDKKTGRRYSYNMETDESVWLVL